jgi:hypothetical protein
MRAAAAAGTAGVRNLATVVSWTAKWFATDGEPYGCIRLGGKAHFEQKYRMHSIVVPCPHVWNMDDTNEGNMHFILSTC